MLQVVKYIVLAWLLLCCEDLLAQERIVAFYNVENLMDTENDPLTYDDNMLPNADRVWSRERYVAKLASVARVVSDMAEQHGFPLLLALAEVENDAVLEDLVVQEALAAANYSYVHYDSSDERGIDVALLYRSEEFTIERSLAVRADVGQSSRDHLLVWGELLGEPVLVIVTHFPSRIGGQRFSSASRERCATQLRHAIDSVQQSDIRRSVIVLGDMNDNPRDKSLKQCLRAVRRVGDLHDGALYNPFFNTDARGSYLYRDRWYQYDQILLSHDFLGEGALSLIRRRGVGGFVFRTDYMVDRMGRPLPTYKSTDYVGGVSDHLPVYVRLRKKR